VVTHLSSSRQRRGSARGATERSRQAVRRLVTTLLAVAAALIALAPGTAHAENSVVNSSPANGTSVSVPPESIVIGFEEDLGEENTVSLTCESAPVPLPAPEVVDDTSLEVEIAEPLGNGTCVIRWIVSNTDGEPNGEGVITFVVQSSDPEGGLDLESASTDPANTAGTTPTTAAVDGSADTSGSDDDVEVVDLSVAGEGNAGLLLTRFASTLLIAVLFGSLVVITAAWPEGVEYLVTIKFLRTVWVLAVVATVAFMAVAAAAVTPDGGPSPLSPSAWLDLMDAGWAGRAVLARVVLLLLAGWVAFRPERAIDPTTQFAALGIPGLCAATIGLSRTIGDTIGLGIAMGILHALAMSIWVGGVVLLARVVLSGPGDEDLVHAVRGFSRVSTPAIVVTIATGLVQMFRLDGGALFESGHGRVVVIKTIVVAVMIFIAFSARQFVAQRLNRAQAMSVPLSARLRRAFGAEAGIGIVTLALSAWLLAFIPPNIDVPTTTPTATYEVTQTHTDDSGTLDVRVSFTDTEIGLVGLEVEVVEPAENLNGLTVVLIAPANEQSLGGIRQPVPLTGAGFAVRDESVGLPISVPGDWLVSVEATTPTGPVTSTEQVLTVTGRDNTEPVTNATVPETTEG
jgi:putative copper export protein/methionine-rich copper-binding protein CopC